MLSVLKGTFGTIAMAGLIAVATAATATTVVFTTFRFGSPPFVTAYSIGDGAFAPLYAIAGATHPRGIAIGRDGKLYVTQPNAITVYPAGAHGNIPPLATICGPSTELDSPHSIALDSRGTIYVTVGKHDRVLEFAGDSNGNVAPVASIGGSNTGLNGPAGIALDASGKIYVTNMKGSSVTVYAAGSKGNVKPVATITGRVKYPVWFEPFSVSVDSRGRIYVLMSDKINVYASDSYGAAEPVEVLSLPLPGAVTGMALDSSANIYLTIAVAPILSYRSNVWVYAAGSKNDAKPIATIAGGSTGLDYPSGVALDSAGKTWVVTDGKIVAYAAGSNGNVKPIATITSDNTGLTQPYGVALGPAGKIYVADKHVGPHSCGRVLVYAPGSYGDARPLASIEGPHTALQQPIGIAVDSMGDVYVTNQEGINQCGPHHSTVADINPRTPFASVIEYSAASVASGGGDIAPSATIGGIGSYITSIALDASGKIYAAVWPGTVRIFPTRSNINTAPIAVITGNQTRIDSPQAIAIDSKGNIYVANAGFQAEQSGNSASITAYPAGSSGNVTPVVVIRGDRTAVDHPVGVALDQSGRVYLISANGMAVYAPGANGNAAPIAKLDGGVAQFSGIAIAPP